MRRFFICLTIILILIFPSCHSRAPRLVIGIALTNTNHAAVELAVKEINQRGGVRGVPVELMGLDWKRGTDFKAEEISAWAKRFSDNNDLVAVVGHSDSSSTLSAAAYYNQYAIPQIVTIATNPSITNIGAWTYRLCPSDTVQGEELAKYAVGEWGKRRVAIFAVNDAYGVGLAEVFSKGVREFGGQVVSTRLHRNVLQADDQAMILDTLRELKQGQPPDLFMLIQRVAAASWTLRAIREAGLRGDVLGSDSLGPSAFPRSAPALAEGMRASEFFYPAGDDAQAQAFIDKTRQAGQGEADYGQVFAYDAIYLVCKAVEAEGFDRSSVKRYLDRLIAERTAVAGAGGAYRLGSDHDARRALYLVEARKGEYRLVKTLLPEGED